jgi:endonuclease/exonuclease/phosphatase family metal-dependent hydrolase
MAAIKTAFWNVENLFDTTASDIATDLEFTPNEGWTPEAFEAKVKNLASIINLLNGGSGPDLLGLCEVENLGVVQQLVAATGRTDLEIAHIDHPDVRGIDTCLVYSNKLFKKPKVHKVKEKSDVWGHLVHLRFPTRDIFQVRLQLKGTGQELHVLVNHWPSRSRGRFESEPHRITVAEHCGRIVDEIVRFPRKEFETVPGSTSLSLAELNARWDRNVLVMGDFNDEPWDRSVVNNLSAGKDEDRIEQALTESNRKLKDYLETRASLFNYMWPVAAEPDRGTHFFSSPGNPNTMNVLDQFAASRGLHFGHSGLRLNRASVEIFTGGGMATGGKKRPKEFNRKTGKGFSDHFPITCLIDIL